MKLLTKEIERKLPGLGTTDNQADPVAYLKLFAPWANWSWYACEYDPESEVCFGLVYGFEAELGHFSLAELAEVDGPFGITIERDTSFEPKPLSRCEDPTGLQENPLKAKPLSVGPVAIPLTVTAENGEPVTLTVHETTSDTSGCGKLSPFWCGCEKSEFGCYPEDGACTCGIYKHHVHCAKCGGVSQVG
ncbi:MAG TPA: DUF2958 domain-containing protein [Sedimentisphaerales bacterium]|nr:DUF2958 domain-containing protein [Sedimentisphaerales bacterium]